MTDYSDEELSRVVAERCGHKHQGEWECLACGFVQVLRIMSAIDGSVGVDEDQGRRVCPNDGKTLIPWVPPFATSMDACLAPGGPVEWLRERKWFTEMLDFGDRFGVRIYPSHDVWLYRGKSLAKKWADTVERALCIAFLAATEGEA